MHLKILIAVVTVCCSLNGLSQKLEIAKTEISDDKIIIYYNIEDTLQNRFYTVRLYSSLDDFMHPLEQISGDAGVSLRPGQKKIVWDPKELGESFNGKVALEIKARTYVPFVHFEGFESFKNIKRLKPYTLTWSGGTPQNILNFDLIHDDKKITTFPNIANVGHHTMLLPRTIRPGIYKLRISDSKNRDDVVFTDEFRVKRKIPLALKMLPALAFSGIVYLMLSKETPQPFSIPDPVTPE